MRSVSPRADALRGGVGRSDPAHLRGSTTRIGMVARSPRTCGPEPILVIDSNRPGIRRSRSNDFEPQSRHPTHPRDLDIMITSILTAFALFLDPTEAGVCEMEEKIIADLESRLEQCEDSISILDQAFLDFAIESGSAASGCESKPTQLEQDVCECLGEGGAGLSKCIADKQGPT
ncbi:hypothetical protein ACNOYE_02085 [Nannocystaceae bacterium ST9]